MLSILSKTFTGVHEIIYKNIGKEKEKIVSFYFYFGKRNNV